MTKTASTIVGFPLDNEAKLDINAFAATRKQTMSRFALLAIDEALKRPQEWTRRARETPRQRLTHKAHLSIAVPPTMIELVDQLANAHQLSRASLVKAAVAMAMDAPKTDAEKPYAWGESAATPKGVADRVYKLAAMHRTLGDDERRMLRAKVVAKSAGSKVDHATVNALAMSDLVLYDALLLLSDHMSLSRVTILGACSMWARDDRNRRGP